MKKLQALRGMHDLLPEESAARRQLEKHFIDTASQYGFSEIRTPIIEELDLFTRSIGEVTDIVEKEMYIFPDKSDGGKADKKTALRPEYTAGCVRSLLEHGLIRQEQKLWYLGPMFRYERPQSGRYRQFTQFGIEHFGAKSPWADVSLLAMTNRLWKKIGISPKLEINSIGKIAERQKYNASLVDYLKSHIDELDKDSQRRINTNPLRVLDSKDEKTRAILEKAPKLMDFLSEESKEDFETIKQALDELSISWSHNPYLVRGIDYYNDLVFEWTSDQLGSQSAICAGGRYDSLVQQLGAREQVPAIGCAIGVERLALLLSQLNLTQKVSSCDIFAICSLSSIKSLVSIEKLHNTLPTWRIGHDISNLSIKSQFKKADKSGALWAIVVGEEEYKNKTISIKFLRENKEQICLPVEKMASFFNNQKGG